MTGGTGNITAIYASTQAGGKPKGIDATTAAETVFEDGSWDQAFTHLHGLRTFYLEPETLFAKKEELDSIVACAPTWQFTLGDGDVLLLDDKDTSTKEWVGPPRPALHTIEVSKRV